MKTTVLINNLLFISRENLERAEIRLLGVVWVGRCGDGEGGGVGGGGGGGGGRDGLNRFVIEVLYNEQIFHMKFEQF